MVIAAPFAAGEPRFSSENDAALHRTSSYLSFRLDCHENARKFPMDELNFDRTDYSVVVKNRAPPPNSWRWEIYRAGRSSPVRHSTFYFRTMTAASKEGKEALKQLLEKIFA